MQTFLMEPNSSSSSSDSRPPSPEEKPQRHFPIKALIIFLVAAQPVLVAGSLYYTEVYNKKAPPLCDPALRAALTAPPLLPDTSFYKDDLAAKTGYEAGWVEGYHEAIQATIKAGCNASPERAIPAYSSPVSTVESAQANGRNDGALAAQMLPRECLNDCWRLAIRKMPTPKQVR